MIVSRTHLYPNGPTVSRLAVGFWRLAQWGMNPAERLTLVEHCLDAGLTTFDHADIYGGYTCEALFGEALTLNPALRHKMELVTKCGIKLVSEKRPNHSFHCYDTSKEHIITSVENSLRALRTDYIDLLLIHRPDPFMDADDTAAGLTAVIQSGKVLNIGVSNFTPSQFDLLASRLSFPLATNQIELSVLYMTPLHDGTLDHCQKLRVAPMAWSPFGGGRLFTAQDEQAAQVRHMLTQIGQELGGATVDQVALAWLLAHPAHIIPVLGSGNWERIQQTITAESLPLSREQWFRIWTASAGHEVP